LYSLPYSPFNPTGEKRVKLRFVPLLLTSSLLFLPGCLGALADKDLVLPQDFQPRQYERLAVINLDPQVQFSEYVEAELLRKGYKVKEGSMVRQLMKKEGVLRESLDAQALAKIGTLLDVQGIVLCRVLEFSRFRDYYRLSIKMVAPETGNAIWSAQGALEGRSGQKSSVLLKEIVVSSLKKLPRMP
jgi:hypothetical protein